MAAEATEPQLAIDFRNCYRCGQDFRANGKERICSTCRKPRISRDASLSQQLTFRERQVAELVRQAKLNKEIAYELHLSEGTIKEYLNRIYRKLGTKNRTELAVWTFMHQVGADSLVSASSNQKSYGTKRAPVIVHRQVGMINDKSRLVSHSRIAR